MKDAENMSDNCDYEADDERPTLKITPRRKIRQRKMLEGLEKLKIN